MGLFDHFKKKEEKPTEILSFLREADKAYIKALESKNAKLFETYCTVPMSRNIAEIISRGELPYFGVERYRQVTWDSLPEEMKYRKHLTHDNVRVTAKVSLALGDDIKEIWSIVMQGVDFKVNDIERIE